MGMRGSGLTTIQEMPKLGLRTLVPKVGTTVIRPGMYQGTVSIGNMFI